MNIKKLIGFFLILGFGLYSFIGGLLLLNYNMNLILLSKDYGFGPLGLLAGIIFSLIGFISISIAIYNLRIIIQNKNKM